METGLRFCITLFILPLAQTRIWSIQIGFDYGGHEYYDENGYHKGFGVDLVDRVCAEGGMDCRIVVDAYSNCWKANKGGHSSPGQGLLSHRYDACLGWFVTVPRIHSLAFSKSYLKEPEVYFFVLKGTRFNPSILSGKKIAFLDVSSVDPKCIAQQRGIANSSLADWQIILRTNKGALIQALQDNQADAIAAMENYWTIEQRNLLDRVPKEMSCNVDGNALMARKDSGIIAAWNTGFNKLTATNGYAKFCQEYGPKHEHKGNVPCLGV